MEIEERRDSSKTWEVSPDLDDEKEDDDSDGEERVASSPTPMSNMGRPDGKKGSEEMLKG